MEVNWKKIVSAYKQVPFSLVHLFSGGKIQLPRRMFCVWKIPFSLSLPNRKNACKICTQYKVHFLDRKLQCTASFYMTQYALISIHFYSISENMCWKLRSFFLTCLYCILPSLYALSFPRHSLPSPFPFLIPSLSLLQLSLPVSSLSLPFPTYPFFFIYVFVPLKFFPCYFIPPPSPIPSL